MTDPTHPDDVAAVQKCERAYNRLRDELSRLDPSRMTPIEALNMLHKLTEEAKT